ncbi:sulfotransferase family protein [Acidihalobacter ferrooxydans]|uniref:Sulfotransferase family protein n=2 Tax=Acidihalobacter ferrooxydans TaxID=1765967 RepID=A0A1P8ULL6_9GAMM|nr:sulfotransferase family protein [Acidihalobacter ferrooxydans]
MWSGPRNLSTALMYAFAARGDCAVWDEPFYAAYLHATGIDHPMRDEVIAAGETDPARVAAACAGAMAQAKPLYYQKHMTLHMLPGFPRDFMRACVNVFLIRHPARVIASYAHKREGPTLDDIGFVQQAQLFDEVADWLGHAPLVVDSADIRAAPRATLATLCAALGIGFTDRMLRWPAGGHADDGVWAAHWYGAVHRSTGFAAEDDALPALTGAYARLAEQALPYYRRLREYAL